MKKNNVFLLLIALFLTLGLHAQQVMLKTPDMTVVPGANIHLDVQVENFDAITGTQFSINWDANVLEYIGVDNFGLPNVSVEGNFGTLDVSQGKLRFAWYQQELTGVSLDDMSTIFSVWFKAIGDPNATTQVMITNDPIVIELVGTQGMVPFQIDNGTVTIEGPNSSKESVTQDFVLFQNSPNPFTEITYISFNLQNNTQARLSIYDNSGKVVFQQNRDFNAGLNKIPVSRDLFQSSGSYFYTLETKKAIATRQLIAQ
jgi:hypothetical protein